MSGEVLQDIFDTHIDPEAYADDWDIPGLVDAVRQRYGVQMPLTPASLADFGRAELLEHLHEHLGASYEAKLTEAGTEPFNALERFIVLQVIDKHWKDHLLAMDHLKEGIGLRGYAQKNPLNEYKREAFAMFVDMTDRIKSDVVEYLFKVELASAESVPAAHQRLPAPRMVEHRGALDGGGESTATKTVRRQGEKVGRNSACPCGSGKKYKRCCGS